MNVLPRVPGEWLVKIRPDSQWRSPNEVERFGDWVLLQGQDEAELSRFPDIVYQEPNYIYQLEDSAVTPASDPRWHLEKLQVPQIDQEGPIVAVLDTGIDLDHPALQGHLWVNPGEIPGDGIDNDGNGVIDDLHGFNANAEDGHPDDAYGHGTHVAGIISSVAPRAKLMAVRIHDANGSTHTAAILRALKYAQKMGASITNNSYGGPAASYALQEAFNEFPALHVMAAGNVGKNNDFHKHYPSNFDIPTKLVVAASDAQDNKAEFSNYGLRQVDIAAPGNEIYSTLKDGHFGYKNGTSMAAPMAAGSAALVLSLNPQMSPSELKNHLKTTGDKLPQWKGTVSSGARLNTGRACSEIFPNPNLNSKEHRIHKETP